VAGTNQPRILIVDDESSVLEALRRQLHGQYELTITTDPKEALKKVVTQGPFEVVVSDLRMPGMDGVALLYSIRTLAPDTVRVLLTGNADLEAATAAVNQGNIFRFLTKPCPTKTLVRALQASVEQYRLLTEQRFRLDQKSSSSLMTAADRK